jgi:hypothetical protein
MYVWLLLFLLRFEIVGARMVWFTQEQAEVFLHIINAGSYKQVVRGRNSVLNDRQGKELLC